jgi:hypothetical protein
MSIAQIDMAIAISQGISTVASITGFSIVGFLAKAFNYTFKQARTQAVAEAIAAAPIGQPGMGDSLGGDFGGPTGNAMGNIGAMGGQGGGLLGAALGGLADAAEAANTQGQGEAAVVGDGHDNDGAGASGAGGDGDGGGIGGPGVGAGEGGGGPGGGPCCFTAGTKVLMQSGYKNIEDVRENDIVKSYDLETGKLSDAVVSKLKTVRRTEHYKILFMSGDTLNITDDHPIFTKDGWASINENATEGNPLYDSLDRVKTLAVGSEVLNEHKWFDTIVGIVEVPGDVITYTLGEVTPNANFFADGFLASNYAC